MRDCLREFFDVPTMEAIVEAVGFGEPEQMSATERDIPPFAWSDSARTRSGPRDAGNPFAALEQHAPELRNFTAADAAKTGKICDGAVAEVLRGIDGVADAAVRLHDDGRLKPFTVPDDDPDPAAPAVTIERAAADRMATPERPGRLRFCAALPRNLMGKLEDWV